MPHYLRSLLACLLLTLTLTITVRLAGAAPASEPVNQPPPVEIVTILVDYTTSTGPNRILGMILAERSTTPPYLSRWRFTGSFNGIPLDAEGLVLEEWRTPNEVVVYSRAINVPPLYELFFTTSGKVTQVSPSRLLFSFAHPPREDIVTTYLIAVDGVIREPGQGSQPVYRVEEVDGGKPFLIDSVGKTARLPGGKPPAKQSWTERVPILRDLAPFLPR